MEYAVKNKFGAQILVLVFVIIMGILWLIFWRRRGTEMYLTIASIFISLTTLFLIMKYKSLK